MDKKPQFAMPAQIELDVNTSGRVCVPCGIKTAFTVAIQHKGLSTDATGTISFGDSFEYVGAYRDVIEGYGFLSIAAESVPFFDPGVGSSAQQQANTYQTVSFEGQCVQGWLSIRNASDRPMVFVIAYAPLVVKD